MSLSWRLPRSSTHLGLGILFLGVLTLPFALTDWDLNFSSAFYQNGNWAVGDQWFWMLLYRWGTLPGLMLSVGSLLVFFASWVWPKLAVWRRAAAVILLTLLLGPGLLVNVLGKGYWGRPRPRDTVAFQGTQPFLRVTQPGIPGKGKSFPSGHPSVGYLFCVFFFLDGAKKRRWIWLGLGLAYGSLLGLGRVIQGAHFVSDVIGSGGLTYISAAVAHDWLWPPGLSDGSQASATSLLKHSGWQKTWMTIAATVLAGMLMVFFLLATPFYKEWQTQIPAPGTVRLIRLNLPGDVNTIQIRHIRQQALLEVRAGYHGFGFPKLRLDGQCQTEWAGEIFSVRLIFQLRGWVTEKKGELRIFIREGVPVELEKKPELKDAAVWMDGQAVHP